MEKTFVPQNAKSQRCTPGGTNRNAAKGQFVVALDQSAKQLRLPRAIWHLIQITLKSNLCIIFEIISRIHVEKWNDTFLFWMIQRIRPDSKVCRYWHLWAYALFVNFFYGKCYIFPGALSKQSKKQIFSSFPKRTGVRQRIVSLRCGVKFNKHHTGPRHTKF